MIKMEVTIKHDTVCGYLANGDSVTYIESLVNCKKCKKIQGIGRV